MINRIKNKEITVGILGLGYVGLPLAYSFATNGVKVLGFDVSAERVEMLNSGKTYIESLMTATALKNFQEKGLFQATFDPKDISKMDACIICVPTPLDIYHQPDLSYVHSSMQIISENLKKGTIVSFESTTYPGTTEEIILPYLTKKGFEIGKDAFICYSPEREDPGNHQFKTNSIPKLVSGQTAKCLEMGLALYALAIEKVIPCSSPKIAEMAKLLENIYRCINISMINEMKMVCDKMGIDIWQVVDAAATKPFGFTPFYPGPGIGGHCIPVDPFYLTWKAKEFGIHANFIELAGEMNFKVQDFVIQKTVLALNNIGIAIKNAKILVIGVAYKKNISDLRESPSLTIMKALENLGANISWHDEFVTDTSYYVSDKNRIRDLNKSIQEFDAILILTNHDGIDYNYIAEKAKLVIDTRGVYKNNLLNIVKA
jgi:UDP-N-acetyl-D-glucosamine dehydrogenase